jgi:hypothetical protein
MKRIIFPALAILALSADAHAQSAVDVALTSAPSRARDDVTVIKWNADHTYEVLREGTNHLVCYDRSDERDRRPFATQCTSLTNLDRIAQNRSFRAQTEDNAEERALIAEAEANGTRAPVEYGSIWFAATGPDQASAGIHVTIAVPGATTESTGFPTTRDTGGVYLMQAGTGGAHLMLPGR